MSTATSTKHLPLRDISPGQYVRIVELCGDRRETSRLEELGLTIGSTIRVCRSGITSIVQLANGSRLCLRVSKAMNIVVAPVEQTPARYDES